jgi:osmotically inducible protein OsmC
MAVTSTADAEWKGTIKEGSGHIKLPKGAYDGEFTFASRFENGKGTTPEEMIAAGHAACFSMQLSGLLTADKHPPTSIHTKAHVTIESGASGITKIVLETTATVPGIENAAFQAIAQKAREICPVTRALAGVKDISLKATLKG